MAIKLSQQKRGAKQARVQLFIQQAERLLDWLPERITGSKGKKTAKQNKTETLRSGCVRPGACQHHGRSAAKAAEAPWHCAAGRGGGPLRDTERLAAVGLSL